MPASRTPIRVVFAAFAACLLAGPVFAIPVVRFTWGSADGMVQRQDWEGPLTYVQTLSVTGLEGTVSELNVSIAVGPYATSPSDVWWMMFPEPWFTPVAPPRLDCAGSPGFTVTPMVPNAAAIPGSTLSAALSTIDNVGSPDPPRGSIQLRLLIQPPLVADPATRYGIAALEYRLQNAEPEASSPLLCDHALAGMCWVGLFAAVTPGGPAMIWEQETLTWQRSDEYCLFAVTPVRVSTWGQVKQIYR